MGYTHYMTQRRNYTKAKWAEVSEDIGAILKFAQHEMGIPLANGMGDAGTSPIMDNEIILFNGVGDDSHEGFSVERVRTLEKWQGPEDLGRGFTKTARKPYDCVVTAVLCYLCTVAESHTAGSDGDGADWLEGLEVARRALPKYANMLDIPMDILKGDRWVGPWVSMRGKAHFDVRFCIDGRGYVIRNSTQQAVCFPTHASLAAWLKKTEHEMGGAYRPPRRTSFGWTPSYEKNIWQASGCFDSDRVKRLGVLQNRVCKELFVNPSRQGAAFGQPPAYVRPNQFPAPEAYISNYQDLLSEAA